MTSFSPPTGYTRIQCVNSFHKLVATPFAEGVNALCWPRTLPGDFGEVVAQLGASEGIATLSDSRLLALAVSARGRVAIDVLLEDQRLLREQGLAPVLDCIHGYPRDEEAGPAPTDVYSFHADSATGPTNTWLCTYYGPPSEGLRNDQAQRRVEYPATRAALLDRFGGTEGADFNAYLEENCHHLHYVPIPDAQPFSFGAGNLWRIAVEYPGSPVPPCIHRAPACAPGQGPRLLLIS